MLANPGLQRLSTVGLSTGCVQVFLWLQVYERLCVTQPPASLSGLSRQPLNIFLTHPNLPSAPIESLTLLTIQRKLNSPPNSSEDRTWYFIVF